MAGHVAYQPIGIVACSAEGAALCYRTLCHEAGAGFGPGGHPEIILQSANYADYLACLKRDDWAGVAEIMLDSTRLLARAALKFSVA